MLLKILGYLGEVDRRRLYLPRGYSSLFEFCTGYLKYSRSAAGRRIHAARCIERFPQVAGMLLAGDVTLTVVSMISGILTNENAAGILSWIGGKSTRDVEMLVSRYRPGFFLRDRVRPICLMMEHPGSGNKCKASLTITPGAGSKCKAGLTSIPAGSASVPTGCSGVSGAGCDAASSAGGGNGEWGSLAELGTDGGCTDKSRIYGTGPGKETVPSSQNGPGKPPNEENNEENMEKVLITQKFRLEFAVEPEFMDKLARVKSLLSTKYPKGINFEQLFDTLLDEYLTRHDPRNRNKKRAAVKGQPGENHPEETNCPADVNHSSASKRSNKSNQPAAAKWPASKRIHDSQTSTQVRSKAARSAAKKSNDETAHPATRQKSGRSGAETRHIPKSVRDEVFERDSGRCTFVGEDGKRCDSDWNLQIDHIFPYAKGGDNSPVNLRLLCAKHNRLAAEHEYGTDFMKRYFRRE